MSTIEHQNTTSVASVGTRGQTNRRPLFSAKFKGQESQGRRRCAARHASETCSHPPHICVSMTEPPLANTASAAAAAAAPDSAAAAASVSTAHLLAGDALCIPSPCSSVAAPR
jgi:hypothetical protein